MAEIKKKHLDRREWYTDSQRDFVCMYHQDGFFQGGIGLITFTGLKKPEVVDTVEGPFCIADNGYQWLEIVPESGHFALTAMFQNGRLFQKYIDVTLKNEVAETGNAAFHDLFLDIVVLQDGTPRIIDTEDLEEALREGVITRDEYELAGRTAEEVANFCISKKELIDRKLYEYKALFRHREQRATEKTLYVTDLDGTLLNRQDRVSPFSIRTINGLVEKGLVFTYATARSLVSASKVTEGLSTNIPVIAYNGAFIFQPSTGAVLSEESFTEAETDRVREILGRYGIRPLVYSFIVGVEKVSWMPRNENDGIRRYLSQRQGDRRFRAVDDVEALYDGKPFYFTCIGEKEELQPIFRAFSGDSRYRCTLQQELYRSEYWCEIMPAPASKSNAILKLKKMWGCSRVISFGDAVNDIPMFEISDECYAVSNAVDELKAVATGIIGSNEEDSVAGWLLSNAGI